MANIKVLLVDDHKIVRDGIKLMLEPQAGINVVAEAEDGEEVKNILDETSVDVIVMDINMPGMNGIKTTKMVKDEHPNIKVLALTMSSDDSHIRQMVQAGASGYIMKSAGRDELTNAIHDVMAGKHYFSDQATQSIMMDLVKNKGKSSAPDPVHITERELEVLQMIVKEHTNQEIAEKLYISPRTVDAHRRNLLQKTGARNTAGLVKYAFQNGLVNND
ncbi:response regulator transcription factor [Rhodohalobacter sp. 8-1]|uniref:response regulator transcription factor n=1 Tax=Rhodohalobacter sp. 8-1 TaxID=3131972 RepID=UPI0030EE3C21